MTELDPTLEMINKEIDRLTKKSSKRALSQDDIKKLESFVRIRQIIVDKPTVIYKNNYDDVTDAQVLAVLKKGNPNKKKPRTKKIVDKANKPVKKVPE